MAVPKRRTSKTRKRQRRAHDAITPPATGICPTCQSPTYPHRLCANCGSYRGETFVKMEKD